MLLLSDSLFERAEHAPLLLLVPVSALILWYLDSRRRRRSASIVDPARHDSILSDVSNARRRLRLIFCTLALALGIAAWLDPVYGDEGRPVEQRGLDIFVCLDVSRSMLARDMAPTRLERAKRDMEALAAHARGDRLGCVAFAGDARVAIPLTHDMDTYAGLVRPLDPQTVRRGGTDLGRAIDLAVESIASGSESEGGEGFSVILLLTDGEDLEGRGLEAAKRAAAAGITVHCVGFGDTRGSKITVSEDGTESFLRDSSGGEVVSAMDEASLRKLAAAAGGEFIRADSVALPLIDLYEKRVAPRARKAMETTKRREKKHRYQWPALGALLFILVDLGVTDRRGASERKINKNED